VSSAFASGAAARNPARSVASLSLVTGVCRKIGSRAPKERQKGHFVFLLMQPSGSVAGLLTNVENGSQKYECAQE
jgi:hypothetical protein